MGTLVLLHRLLDINGFEKPTSFEITYERLVVYMCKNVYRGLYIVYCIPVYPTLRDSCL
jgi:hypothetical protein